MVRFVNLMVIPQLYPLLQQNLNLNKLHNLDRGVEFQYYHFIIELQAQNAGFFIDVLNLGKDLGKIPKQINYIYDNYLNLENHKKYFKSSLLTNNLTF